MQGQGQCGHSQGPRAGADGRGAAGTCAAHGRPDADSGLGELPGDSGPPRGAGAELHPRAPTGVASLRDRSRTLWAPRGSQAPHLRCTCTHMAHSPGTRDLDDSPATRVTGEIGRVSNLQGPVLWGRSGLVSMTSEPHTPSCLASVSSTLPQPEEGRGRTYLQGPGCICPQRELGHWAWSWSGVGSPCTRIGRGSQWLSSTMPSMPEKVTKSPSRK